MCKDRKDGIAGYMQQSAGLWGLFEPIVSSFVLAFMCASLLRALQVAALTFLHTSAVC
jgi:hypothetical protein